jgi:hypothetical protein
LSIGVAEAAAGAGSSLELMPELMLPSASTAITAVGGVKKLRDGSAGAAGEVAAAAGRDARQATRGSIVRAC